MKQAFPLLGLVLLAPLLMPSQAVAGPAPDSVLCWSQLELLMSRQKLTEDEAAVYQAQCTCLEQKERGNQPQGEMPCTTARHQNGHQG